MGRRQNGITPHKSRLVVEYALGLRRWCVRPLRSRRLSRRYSSGGTNCFERILTSVLWRVLMTISPQFVSEVEDWNCVSMECWMRTGLLKDRATAVEPEHLISV